jgi:hypothetical protein
MKPTLKGGFWANDSNGEPVLIQLWKTWTAGVSGPEEDRVILQLEDGRRVTRHDQGRYEVLDTGEELTSDNPNAP